MSDAYDDELIESCMLYGHQVIRRAKYKEIQAENKRLKSLNHRLNTEYKKTWEVLRTYNPKDIELEYIGFETV